eukprot:759436-Hanusia_phi.AAC.4
MYATHPTKAIMPILLEDYRKISVERRGVEEKDMFTSQQIKDCMMKVTPCALEETIMIEDDFEIRPYYAGHVLGAAMFYIRVGQQSILYTGDYNMTPDRHLGSARCDKLRPDLLITESTYATTIRESKRWRERDMLNQVSDCVRNGGKVLIPVFALGRAQELCLLLDAFWERTGLKVPIYFSAGLTEKANLYYKMYISWTNQKIKDTFVKRNVFDFQHIQPFDRAFIDRPGPMVLFATPGMLHGGLSMEVFKKWAPSDKNLVIMPGYCVAGTLGHKIKHLSFSAHADAKGIMTLIKQAHRTFICRPRHKMEALKQRIKAEFGLPCYDPANGATTYITTFHGVPVQLSTRRREEEYSALYTKRTLAPTSTQQLSVLLLRSQEHDGHGRVVCFCPLMLELQVLDELETSQMINMPQCDLSFRHNMKVDNEDLISELVDDGAFEILERFVQVDLPISNEEAPDRACVTVAVGAAGDEVGGRQGERAQRAISEGVETDGNHGVTIEYSYRDLELARKIWRSFCESFGMDETIAPAPLKMQSATKQVVGKNFEVCPSDFCLSEAGEDRRQSRARRDNSGKSVEILMSLRDEWCIVQIAPSSPTGPPPRSPTKPPKLEATR